jgi:hypothetical protein
VQPWGVAWLWPAPKGSGEGLKKHISELEANPNRGVRDTLDLAQGKARDTIGDFTRAHPGLAVGAGTLGGALMGGSQGPALVQSLKNSGGHLKALFGGSSAG